jgi:hypothetical protein
MFTVLHCFEGRQQTITAKSVSYYPAGSLTVYGKGSSPQQVICYITDSEEYVFVTGTIFVMNDNGKTVAKYCLE